MLTGEPVPVTKRPGDKLIGATINANGSLVMRSEKVGSQTMLSQIVQMVANAQRSRAPMQRLADVVAGYFVVIVVGIALLTLFGWGFFGPEPSWVYGFVNAVSVLIIACPCALGWPRQCPSWPPPDVRRRRASCSAMPPPSKQCARSIR
jgi:Cu+-exporting ATPase